MTRFSNKMYSYFQQAKRHRKDRAWFEEHKPTYLAHVREPFAHIVSVLDREFGPELPRIWFHPKKITQPIYRVNRIPEDGSVLKIHAHASFAERPTSRFEWNPGLYFSFGLAEDENVMGVGLYMTSSRQISLLRDALANAPDESLSILEDRRLTKRWGKLQGERYARFPRGFDPESPAAKYIWHKQFYFGQNLNRTTVTSAAFERKVIADVAVALPFLKWLRKTVGVYKR